MALFGCAHIEFTVVEYPEFPAGQIGRNQRQIPLAGGKTVHDEAPFLTVVKLEDFRALHTQELLQYGSGDRNKGILIQ
ncbi:hypothetical protein D3C71_1799700 [compost metagenome]